MKNTLTRRDFLKYCGIGTLGTAAAFALAGCAQTNTGNETGNTATTDVIDTEITADVTETVVNENVTEDTVVSSNADRFEKVTVAFGEAFDTMTPDGGTKGGAKAPILTAVMEGLFIIQDGDYYGIMAKNWEATDELHYTVELYDNIVDSEGNAITADDVVYSYEYFKANGTIPKFDLYESVKAVDTYKVEFSWTSAPSAILALEHIWGGTPVVSQASHESHTYATDPIGTGPYAVSEFSAGLKVVLEARDDYWQADEQRAEIRNANVQTIQYDIITEATQRVIALENGSVDFSSGVAYDSLGAFQEGGAKDGEYNVDVRASGSITTLNPNCDPISPCSDINLRLAIFYALNNEALAIAWPAGGAVAAKCLGSDYYGGYDPAWDTEENYITVYDPELAKDYLSKSSYNKETLTILCQSGNAATLAEVIQNMLLEVGINTDIVSYDYATWLSTQKDPANFDLIMMGSGGGAANICLGWNRPFTVGDWGTGKTIGYVDDPELNEMLVTIKTVEGGTPENVNKMRQHWMANAYTYPTINAKTFNVYNSQKFATMFYDCDGNLVPGASTYIMG